MGSGYSRTLVGSVNSTNAAQKVVTGFRPIAVRLWLEDGASGFWEKGMADASAFKRITAGTGSFVTADGITPLEDGFTLGADANLNPASATVVHYEAVAG